MEGSTDQDLEAALRAFAQKHGFAIPEDQWQFVQEGQQHEMEDGLYSVFEGHGVEGTAETGTGPADYLPSIILNSIQMLECDQWRLEEVDSDDDWLTAKVVLYDAEDSEFRFTLDGVDNSDWVAFDVFTRLNRFAREHSKLSLVVFCSDDPYRVLAMPHAAATELASIIDRFKEPY